MSYFSFSGSIRIRQQRPNSPVPDCVSMKSDGSMFQPIDFKDEHHFVDEG